MVYLGFPKSPSEFSTLGNGYGITLSHTETKVEFAFTLNCFVQYHFVFIGRNDMRNEPGYLLTSVFARSVPPALNTAFASESRTCVSSCLNPKMILV